MRAIVVMTLTEPGFDAKDLPTTLKTLQAAPCKSHKRLVPMAAARLMVRANMNIIERAAMDDDTIYGRFLTLQRDFHQIMAGGNTKHGGNGHDRTPFPSSFVPEEPSPPAAPAAQEHEPGSIVVDGQEYVKGDV